jgi:hypothetical protein
MSSVNANNQVTSTTVGPTTLHQAPPGFEHSNGLAQSGVVVYDDDVSYMTGDGDYGANTTNEPWNQAEAMMRPTSKTIRMKNPLWRKHVRVEEVDSEYEPRHLYTRYFPNSTSYGRLLRDATSGAEISNAHRVGSRMEDTMFKVKMVVSKHHTGVLYYNSPGEFERAFYHDKISLPHDTHTKWEVKNCRAGMVAY